MGERSRAPSVGSYELPRTRAEAERALDRLVLENRFTIAVVFPAMGAVLLLASAESLLGPLNFDPYLVLFGTLVMRLPLIAGLAPLTDRRAAIALGLLTAYAIGVELLGVTTGFPYGSFEYGVELGPMLFGKVPLGLPVFFFPLVLNSYLLVSLLLGGRAASAQLRLAATVGTVLLVDLVLDPGAVALGFWAYDLTGVEWVYYGVPWTNYAGWVLSATVAVLAFDLGFDRAGLRRRLDETPFMLDDLVSFAILWGVVNAYFGQWVPVLLAAALGAGLLYTDRFDFLLGAVRPLGR
jgi:putative membrane protein